MLLCTLLSMPPQRNSSQPGITNRQAKRLAALQRQLGERYVGNGLSRDRAADEIERCERELRELGIDILDADRATAKQLVLLRALRREQGEDDQPLPRLKKKASEEITRLLENRVTT